MQSLQGKNIKCVYSPRELKKIKEKQKTDRIKIQAEIITALPPMALNNIKKQILIKCSRIFSIHSKIKLITGKRKIHLKAKGLPGINL